MAIEAGKVVISDKGIETLNFELSKELVGAKELIFGFPTIEFRRMDGEDKLEYALDFDPYEAEKDADGNYVPKSVDWRDVSLLRNDDTVMAAISDDKKSASITVRANRRKRDTSDPNDKFIERSDCALDSIWEVICYMRTAPGGNAYSASMIVVGAG